MLVLKHHFNVCCLIAAVFVLHSLFALFPPLQGDEASFWEWSRHLAFGYYAHPPMTAWLIALTTGLFSTTQYTVRLTSILLHILTLIYVYRLALDISGKKEFSFVATLICSLMPISVLFGTGITTDSSLVCFYTLAVFYCRRAVVESDGPSWYLAAAACGGMLLSKFMAFLFFPGVFLFCLLNRQFRRLLRSKEPYLAFLLAFSLFSPFLIWNYQNDWLTFQFNFLVRHQDRGFDPIKPLLYFGGQMLAASPMLWIVLLLSLFRVFHPRKDRSPKAEEPVGRSLAFVGYVTAFPLLYYFALCFTIRIGAHWAAVVYPSGSVLIAAWYYTGKGGVRFVGVSRPFVFKLSLATSVLLLVAIVAPAINPALFFPDRLLYTERIGENQPPISHYYGWNAVGKRIRQLEREWGERPEGFFFTAKDYSIASMLGFYTPDRPQFYLMNFPKDGIHGKDFLIWEKGNKKIGANTIYVTDTFDSYRDRLEGFFKRIEELPPFVVRDRKGRILRIFYFTLGLHYLGGEPDNLSVI